MRKMINIFLIINIYEYILKKYVIEKLSICLELILVVSMLFYLFIILNSKFVKKKLI